MPNRGLIDSTKIERDEHDELFNAKRITDVGNDQDVNLDYDVRTDDNAVYVGIGARGLADSAGGWLIFKLAYDISNRLTSKKSAVGIWNNRGSLF